MPDDLDQEIIEDWDAFFWEWLQAIPVEQRTQTYDFIMDRALNPFPGPGSVFAPSGLDAIGQPELALLVSGIRLDDGVDWDKDTLMSPAEFSILMKQNYAINPDNEVQEWWQDLTRKFEVLTKAGEEISRDQAYENLREIYQKNADNAWGMESEGMLTGYPWVIGFGGVIKKAGMLARGLTPIPGFVARLFTAKPPQILRWQDMAKGSLTPKAAAEAKRVTLQEQYSFGGKIHQMLFGTLGRAAKVVGGGLAILGGIGIGMFAGMDSPFGQMARPEGAGPSPIDPPSPTTIPRGTTTTPGTTTTTQALPPQIPTPPETPGTTLSLFGRTGDIAAFNQPAPGIPWAGSGVATPGTAFSADLTDALMADEINLTDIEAYIEDQEAFNPLIAGQVDLPYQKFPEGITLRGERPGYIQPVSPTLPGGLEGPAQPPMEVGRTPEEQQRYGQVVPPAATIIPGAFESYQYKTLIQHAADASDMYDIPLEVLYGVISVESGWDPNAVSASGDRMGLAQIETDLAEGGLPAQFSTNPVTALRYAAQRIARGYQQTGSWEGAVIAVRDPEAAIEVSESGKFDSSFQKAYLSAVADTAMASGLGNILFGGEGSLLEAGKTRGSGGGGGGGGERAEPGFRAPDPATLTQFARSTINELVGREEPTDEEIDRAISALTGLYRQAFDADRQYAEEGGEVPHVSPTDRFYEAIHDSGEADFRRERTKTRGMMEYMSNIAAMLQGSG